MREALLERIAVLCRQTITQCERMLSIMVIQPIDYFKVKKMCKCILAVYTAITVRYSHILCQMKTLYTLWWYGIMWDVKVVFFSIHRNILSAYPYPEPVYTGWSSVHWNATGMPLVDPVYTGIPLEKLSWNSRTLECHWRNLLNPPHTGMSLEKL